MAGVLARLVIVGGVALAATDAGRVLAGAADDGWILNMTSVFAEIRRERQLAEEAVRIVRSQGWPAGDCRNAWVADFYESARASFNIIFGRFVADLRAGRNVDRLADGYAGLLRRALAENQRFIFRAMVIYGAPDQRLCAAGKAAPEPEVAPAEAAHVRSLIAAFVFAYEYFLVLDEAKRARLLEQLAKLAWSPFEAAGTARAETEPDGQELLQ